MNGTIWCWRRIGGYRFTIRNLVSGRLPHLLTPVHQITLCIAKLRVAALQRLGVPVCLG